MRIVKAPIGHRCAGNPGTKHIRRFEHQHERHVAAVAPAPDADACGVYIPLCGKPACTLHLIGHFDVAQFVVNGRLERRATECGAAIVELENDVAGASQDLREGTTCPIVENPLYAGTAVNVDDGGVMLGRVEVSGLVE